MIFCTLLFNWAFLPQGIALYRSLERTCKSDFVLYVLCMDSFTFDVLAELNFAHLRMIPLQEIEDEALNAARANRTIAEFCWTCTTPLLLYLQKAYGAKSSSPMSMQTCDFFLIPRLFSRNSGRVASSSMNTTLHQSRLYGKLLDASTWA
jgi:hypothetical protein